MQPLPAPRTGAAPYLSCFLWSHRVHIWSVCYREDHSGNQIGKLNQWVLDAKEAGFSEVSITFTYFSIRSWFISPFPFHTYPLRSSHSMLELNGTCFPQSPRNSRGMDRRTDWQDFHPAPLQAIPLGFLISFILKKGFWSFKMFSNHSSGPVFSLYIREK